MIPLFEELQWARDHNLVKHLVVDKCQLEVSDTLNRLKVKYQAYKSAYFLEKRRKNDIYNRIFTVDYTLDSYKGRYVADLSFTFLHWNLMEKLKNRTIQVSQIDKNSFQKLIYNILPSGTTVFHYLSEKGNIMTEILKVCHPNPSRKELATIETHIPYLENFDDKSPIDLLCPDKKDAKSDFKTANTMLQYLACYGIDHHSRSIARNMPKLVQSKLPFLKKYIDSRLKQTADCLSYSKGNLRTENSKTGKPIEPEGVFVASYCLSDEAETAID